LQALNPSATRTKVENPSSLRAEVTASVRSKTIHAEYKAVFPDEPRKVKQIGSYIVADPNTCHGRLTFRGTRVFVSDILEPVDEGMPFDVC
jgi:hypothetical protein